MADWREAVLAGVAWQDAAAAAPGPVAVRWGHGPVAGTQVSVAAWDFAVAGGSFGVAEASAFCAAAAHAQAARQPLVSFLRSGGTRLQQGAAALAGMARSTLALRALADAGLAHLAIADQPTTGGVWVSVGSRADLRAGVAGAVVGFGGPRVVEAVTGAPVPPDSHTAAAAAAAGLLDAVLDPAAVSQWLAAVLGALAGPTEPTEPTEPTGPTGPTDQGGPPLPPGRGGWAQVLAARDPAGSDPADWARDRLDGPVALAAADPAVASFLGRLAGRGAVAVAVGTRAHRRPGPTGFHQLTRAARLADRLGLALVTVVDTPGAEPGPAAERDGVAPAIGAAMDAVLSCRSPTVAVLRGEGGSGGALAALVCDRVLVGADGYLAALVPEGAAVTLRTTPERAAELMALRPADLAALGLADAVGEPEPEVVLARLWQQDPATRLAARRDRWLNPLPGYPLPDRPLPDRPPPDHPLPR